MVRFLRSTFLLALTLSLGLSAHSQRQPSLFDPAAERALRHSTPEWQLVADHLPNPDTAKASELQQAADILRARRLLEDAIEYYNYALVRGGDEATLFNRIGVTNLEMNQIALARICFRRAITARKNDAQAWNNLGAAENIAGNFRDAISDYQRAVKIERRNALFHANLGTAYFAINDNESARRQFNIAVKLDPQVFERGGFGGSQVHVLASSDRGRLAFEMARLAAGQHQEESMMHWLAQAAEAGLDVRQQMLAVKEFAAYLKDPRIALLIRNAQSLRSQQLTASGPVPTLSEAK